MVSKIQELEAMLMFGPRVNLANYLTDEEKARNKEHSGSVIVPPSLVACLNTQVYQPTSFVPGIFAPEVKSFDIRRFLESTSSQTTYLLVKTDSTSQDASDWVYERIIDPVMVALGYTEDARNFSQVLLRETFVNAKTFGNKAGEVGQYKDRTAEELPQHEVERLRHESEMNRQKPIYLEALITPKLTILRVTDTGHGYDPTKVPRTPEPPTNVRELPIDEQLKYLMPTGRGITLVEKYTGSLPLVRGGDGCAVSFVMYADSQSPSIEKKTA